MSASALAQTRMAVAIDDFREIDNGDPAGLEIMTDDVEVYFPKFGVGRGKDEFLEVVKGLRGSVQSIQHDFDRMTFHVAGDNLIVESFEGGVMADGSSCRSKACPRAALRMFSPSRAI